MEKVFLLVDYQGHFGSKHSAVPYRSGMEKEKLEKHFCASGYATTFVPFSQVVFRKNKMMGSPILYTSQEGPAYYYKDFIEDIVLGLEMAGANVIPSYKYLRAHNNKVFMEILRDQLDLEGIKNIRSSYFGTLEEAMREAEQFEYPVVVKGASGAMSENVALARSKYELRNKLKSISATRNAKNEMWELARSVRHRGYMKESRYQHKFVIQNFISNLKDDWKILIFHDRYYALNRKTRDNDFRASGSGKFFFTKDVPKGMLHFAESVFQRFNVPHISIDVAYDGAEFYLVEFQAVYFGTTAIEKAPFYFRLENKSFECVDAKSELEKVYVESVVRYLTVKYKP